MLRGPACSDGGKQHRVRQICLYRAFPFFRIHINLIISKNLLTDAVSLVLCQQSVKWISTKVNPISLRITADLTHKIFPGTIGIQSLELLIFISGPGRVAIFNLLQHVVGICKILVRKIKVPIQQSVHLTDCPLRPLCPVFYDLIGPGDLIQDLIIYALQFLNPFIKFFISRTPLSTALLADATALSESLKYPMDSNML